MIHTLALFVLGMQAPKEPPIPPALTKLSVLAGGVWTGLVGESMPVKFEFRLEERGRYLVGDGLVGTPEKPILKIRTTVGIDPATGEAFYLDVHNSSTVYFGKVTENGKGVDFDFQPLTGGKGHWISKVDLTDTNSYSSTMFSVGEDGKQTEMHTLKLTRKS